MEWGQLRSSGVHYSEVFHEGQQSLVLLHPGPLKVNLLFSALMHWGQVGQGSVLYLSDDLATSLRDVGVQLHILCP